MSIRSFLLLSISLLAPASALAHDGVHHIVAPEGTPAHSGSTEGRKWLAGDHHIHSEWSAKYAPNPNDPNEIPTPLFGKDGRYSIIKNAQMAREHGLSWIVSTDHGGPNHSKINHDNTYPALQESRKAVPEVLQFFGMEFDTPAGDHSSLIVPHTEKERTQLYEIEAGFSRRDAHPADPARNTEEKAIEALKLMRSQEAPPVLIANHPSRSAPDMGVYGHYMPHEFRNWNDTAPQVAVGMEGAPGHQAAAINPDGSLDEKGRRGGYRNFPTLGGFDQMAARLGGFWDSMLGEGRRWWITATSDSHRHWREGGSDFWPGEYSKTYVLARHEYADILDGIRNGRVFVTTGDLISELDVKASGKGDNAVGIGGELVVGKGEDVTIEIRLRDPAAPNAGGRTPDVARVDLIMGAVTGPVADRSADTNPTTRVEHRFTASEWKRDGEYLIMAYTIRGLDQSSYIRLRGTNTSELEPSVDPAGEDPWSDLWFYSNPVFLTVKD